MTHEAGLVEMCMEEISTNLEELSFLRELASHLRLEPVPRRFGSARGGFAAHAPAIRGGGMRGLSPAGG